MQLIQFLAGQERTCEISSLHGEEVIKENEKLVLRDIHGSPSSGYHAHVFSGAQMVGYAKNHMNGQGWSVTIDLGYEEREQQERSERRKEVKEIQSLLEQRFCPNESCETFVSPGLIQVASDRVTVSFVESTKKVDIYYKKEDRFDRGITL